MPGVVSDSSTLIHLSAIGRLMLLQRFYGQVLMPPAVWREVVEEGRGRPGAREVEEAVRAGWLKIVSPSHEVLLHLLQRTLDDGEAEAIALAIEQHAEIVLLDESEAREIASLYGLRKTGVVGLLIRATLEGHLPSLRQELDKLRMEAGFWMSENLYRQALEAVGEGMA